MSDNYQAVYDAVRSVSERPFALLHQEVLVVSHELTRPSRTMRPRIFKDGTEWCALYGENLQDGVCGFGESPEEACQAFDAEWTGQPAKEGEE